MKKFNKIINIIESLIIGIITFLIVCPMEQNKILLVVITSIYFLIQLLKNREEIIRFYIKPNLIMYPIYIWIIIHMVADFIFNIPYIDAINTIACAFIISLYLYCFKSQKNLKIIAIVSISTIIMANFITIIELIKNPDISRVISGSDVGKVKFGIRKLFIYIWINICNIFTNRKIIFKRNKVAIQISNFSNNIIIKYYNILCKICY